MHKLYLQKHEPEQYNLLERGKDIDPLVKYEYFKFFSENFKMSFGKPKLNNNKIDSADSDEQKRKLNRRNLCFCERPKHFTRKGRK